jgi:hypothetical protein
VSTVFEGLANVKTDAVDVKINVQVTNLGTIGTTVRGLLDHPPQGIEDVLGAVRTGALPALDLGGDLPAAFGALQDIIPGDLSELTGELAVSVETLSTALDDDLVGSVTTGLRSILALHRLLDIDASCLTEPGSPTDAASPSTSPVLVDPLPASSTPAAASPSVDATATARATAGVAAATAALDAIPASFDVVDVARLVAETLALRDGLVARRPIPIFDDFREGLDTLLRWTDHGQPDEILKSLQRSLDGLVAFVEGSVGAAFGTLASESAAAFGALGSAELGPIADGLVARLGELRDARSPVEAAPAVEAINTMMDSFDATAAALQPALLDHLPAIEARLHALPAELDDQVAHVAAVLGPTVSLPRTFPGPDPAIPLDAEAAETIRALVSPVVGWLQDVLATLDLTKVEEPITAAVNAVSGAADDVEDSIAGASQKVQALVAEVERKLQALDVTAVAKQFEQAMGQFRKAVVDRLTAVLAPVGEVLGTAIATIDQAVGAFHPAEVTAAVTSVVADLEKALANGDLEQAREAVEAAFTAAEQAISSLSFSPVTDEVVGLIEQITDALKALDPGSLSAPLQLALQGAAALLPEDLDPITEPLLGKMQDAIDAGPATLVDELHAPFALLEETVGRLSPGTLIGDQLFGPFDEIVAQIKALKPSSLLEPVEAELALFKQRLGDEISPHQLLAPLAAPFDELLGAFDQLKPELALKPLQEAIDSALGKVVAAADIGDLLAPVDVVVSAVNDVAAFGTAAVALADRVMSILEQLGAPGRVQAFADAVLLKLAKVDASSLQTRITAVAAAVDATKSAPLQARRDVAVGPLIAAVQTLSPEARLAQVAAAHAAVPRDLGDATNAVLDRVDPSKPPLAVAYHTLAAFQHGAADAAALLATELEHWDDRYHRSAGTLASVAGLQADAGALQGWVRDAVEPQVVAPLRALLAPAGPLRTLLMPLLGELKALVADLTAKASQLEHVGGAAGTIKDTMESLVERLGTLALGDLTNSLDELFEGLRAKLQAIGPAAFEPALVKTFDAVLDAIDVRRLIPIAAVEKLDDDVAKLVKTLEAVNPRKIVETLEALFDKKIRPLVEAFDLGGLLDALLEKLRGLRGELEDELERVNTAYRAMLAAIPPFDPLSIEVDVDLGGLL